LGIHNKAKQRPELSPEAFNNFVIECIQDIKGKNIVKLDLRHLDEAPTDFFIVCEGDSVTQVKSIADNVYQRLKDEYGILPEHFEGQRNATWILLDFFNIVVHVFHPESRAFYELEDLWSDAIITEYQNL